MSNATLTTISPILNKIIFPTLQRLISKKVIFLDQIKKNVRTTIANNEIYVSGVKGYHSGFYTAAEGSAAGVGNSAYLQMKALVKFIFMTYGFTDQALTLASKQGKEAIAGTFDAEFETGMITAKKQLNRIFHGAATGKLCVANGAGSSSTALTVDGCPAVGGTGRHTKYLAAGQNITIGTTEATISSVDSDTGVTLDASESWSDNDVITLSGDDEPMGLAGHIDDGDNVATYQNLARSTNPVLKSQVDDTSEALNEAGMTAVVLRAMEFGFGDGKCAGLCNQDLWAKYGALLLSLKRNTDPKPVLGGGWTGLELFVGSTSVPIICDFDTWDGYVQFVDFSKLTIAQACEMFEWLGGYEGDGNALIRSGSVNTTWEGTQKWYMNLVGLDPQALARLSGKTV